MKINSEIFLFISSVVLLGGIFADNLEKVNDELLEECKVKSGNSDIEYHFWVKRYQLDECYGDYINKYALHSDFKTFLDSNDTVVSSKLLVNITAGVARSFDCAQNYLNEYRICFDKNHKNINSLETSQSNIRKLVQYVTKTDVINVYKQHQDVQECLGDRNTKFNLCIENSRFDLREIPMPSIMASPQLTAGLVSTKECITSLLRECNGEAIIDIFENLSDFVNADMLVQLLLVKSYTPGIRPHKMQTHEKLEFYKRIKELYENDESLVNMITEVTKRIEVLEDFKNRMY